MYAHIGDILLLLQPPGELRRMRIRQWQERRLRFVVNTGCIRDTLHCTEHCTRSFVGKRNCMVFEDKLIISIGHLVVG